MSLSVQGAVNEREAWSVLMNGCVGLAVALQSGSSKEALMLADELLARTKNEQYVWPLTRSIVRGVGLSAEMLRQGRSEDAREFVERFLIPALTPTGDQWGAQ